jgi:mono/diheme cytochrome c family protein
MKRAVIALVGLSLFAVSLVAAGRQALPSPAPTTQPKTTTPAPAGPAAATPRSVPRRVASTGSMSAVAMTELVTQYCVSCHTEKRKPGGLSLEGFDAAQAQEHPDMVEKMIRKLRAGMMPPSGAKRPEDAQLQSFVGSLETRMDEFATVNPNPGWRPFQRLARAEYARAVDDLLGVQVDVTPYLPADTLSHGFDNIADSQGFSPTLLDGYLRAASQVSRLAVGDRRAAPTSATYKVLAVESQMQYVEGAPIGSRGGIAVRHTFPADGNYVFKVTMVSTVSGELFGNTGIALSGKNEVLEISINGERAAVLEVTAGMSDAGEKGFGLDTPPIHVKAGPQLISAAFVPRFAGPVDDLMAPIDHTLIDTRIGTGFGITALPHLKDLTIAGPMQVTGVSDTPSRRKIFSCRPTSAAEERPCATEILKKLSTQAYRGPVPQADFDDLMTFYDQGRSDGGDFESGVRMAVQGMLANPRFVFRFEPVPATAAKSKAAYKLGDVELASRLSFFLWGTVPDAELVKAAMSGTLKAPAVFDTQVRRMLADPKSEALASRFGAQWLRLQDIDKIRPDGLQFPQWDRSLSEAFRRETELFFDSLVREDRSVLDLLNADYTFVNERLARHYGLPNVTGPSFRKVALPPTRRGILTQGSVLLLTSVADRTSPVQRGKWIMQVLLGSPPPPPPPNVPGLDDSVRSTEGGRQLSVRERMEQHRANPACNSCHRVIDPLGLALENFDVTGQYRIKDNGVPVDSKGTLYDGTEVNGVDGLRAALTKYKGALLNTFTENLMTYAVGRRLEAYDMPTVRSVVRNAARNDYKISSFVLGIVDSPAFKMINPAAADTTEDASRQSAVGRARTALEGGFRRW